jgi:uncharacterized phage protein (TIGR01671 family)
MNNRELKFRAFYQKKLYMQEYCGGFSYFIHNDSDALTLEDIFVAAERQKCIIQQYTGLKDSKGVEIYEGDILERIQSPGEPRNYYQVIWHDYMWIAVCTRKNYSHCLDQFNEVKQCKIVGNIFDKPELIKNK